MISTFTYTFVYWAVEEEYTFETNNKSTAGEAQPANYLKNRTWDYTAECHPVNAKQQNDELNPCSVETFTRWLPNLRGTSRAHTAWPNDRNAAQKAWALVDKSIHCLIVWLVVVY
jgi:hypothetical protein